jgi:hypothetical protein
LAHAHPARPSALSGGQSWRAPLPPAGGESQRGFRGSGQHLLCASAPLRDIKCIWCSVAGLWRGVVHVAKLSPSPLGEGLGWGLEVYATLTDPTPSPPLKGRGYLGNYRDNCVIPEIALYYDGSGQHLLLVFASLCEIILALGFHLHERGVVRGRWGGAPHPASTNERARKSAQPSPARGEGPTRLALLLCLGDRASRPLNSGDICVIPEIALYYDGSGRYLLFVFASLCEIILALRFDRA